jgi:glycine cleavage system H protein
MPGSEAAMKLMNVRLKEHLIVAASVLLIIAALPLLAVGLFVLRIGLVAAALVAIVAAGSLAVMSRRFRQKVRAAIDPTFEYKGLQLSTGVGLDTAHSWATVEPDGAFVGVDDLAATCLGPVGRVVLPAPGQRIRHGEPLFTLARGSRELTVPSPVTGTVSARNEALLSDPERVNRDPFGLGWVARVRTDDPRSSRRRLMRGFRAQRWFRDEVDRLTATLGASGSAIPTLPDGGAVVDELYRVIDDPTWRWLKGSFFGDSQETDSDDTAPRAEA